jgi:hypothetical protein
MRRAVAAVSIALSGAGAIFIAAHEPHLLAVCACLAPAAAAFVTLRAGRYPAARALVRLSGSRRRRLRPAPRRSAAVRVRPVLVRGGRLVGAAIAGRSPPARAAAGCAAA